MLKKTIFPQQKNNNAEMHDALSTGKGKTLGLVKVGI